MRRELERGLASQLGEVAPGADQDRLDRLAVEEELTSLADPRQDALVGLVVARAAEVIGGGSLLALLAVEDLGHTLVGLLALLGLELGIAGFAVGRRAELQLEVGLGPCLAEDLLADGLGHEVEGLALAARLAAGRAEDVELEVRPDDRRLAQEAGRLGVEDREALAEDVLEGHGDLAGEGLGDAPARLGPGEELSIDQVPQDPLGVEGVALGEAVEVAGQGLGGAEALEQELGEVEGPLGVEGLELDLEGVADLGLEVPVERRVGVVLQ